MGDEERRQKATKTQPVRALSALWHGGTQDEKDGAQRQARQQAMLVNSDKSVCGAEWFAMETFTSRIGRPPRCSPFSPRPLTHHGRSVARYIAQRNRVHAGTAAASLISRRCEQQAMWTRLLRWLALQRSLLRRLRLCCVHEAPQLVCRAHGVSLL